jgi:histidyl-tRNA synthetase
MIFEHEIPAGSRLYFGKTAKIKREIESKSASILESLGFEEIVTPLFSYHQKESFENSKDLIRLSDDRNHEVNLRADSTVDVIRIITKRLGRSIEHKKWFYIQPLFNFPTKERYQVGAELIGGSIVEACNTSIDILKALEIYPSLQIPEILNKRYGVLIEHIESMNIQKLLEYGFEWMAELIAIQHREDLADLEQNSNFPADIKEQLMIIKEFVDEVEYEDVIISPLFYTKFRYYDSLIFRLFEGNSLFSKGGYYSIDDIKFGDESVRYCGFSIEIDRCIAKIVQKDSDVK